MSDDDKSREAIYIDALHELANEQADRIEQLEAELVRTFNNMMAEAKRVEQLEAALREIADGPRDASRSFAWLFTDLKIEARKALDAK